MTATIKTFRQMDVITIDGHGDQEFAVLTTIGNKIHACRITPAGRPGRWIEAPATAATLVWRPGQ